MLRIYGGRVESIRLVGEDDGWHLEVDTDDENYTFNVHGVPFQLKTIGEEVGSYLAEGQRAALQHAADLAAREADDAHDSLVGDV